MEVLILTLGIFHKGGIQRYGRYQVRALRESFGRRDVRVLSLAGRQQGDFEEPLEVEWSGPVPLTRTSRLHFAAVAVRHMLIRRPDVVLTHHVNLGPLAWPLARLRSGRLVQTIFGREVWSGLSVARRSALRASDLVIADCRNTAEKAREQDPRLREPAIVRDCVDLRRYTPGAASPAVLRSYAVCRSSRFRLLFLGRLNAAQRYKGTERLLGLVRDLPPDRFEAIIAGTGDDVEHLRRLAVDLGVGDRVAFPGEIRETDMPHIYRSADAFYLVSEAGPGKGEGIPMTPLEALACGVPVLVGNRDGSRETLDGAGGLCSDPDDVDAATTYLRQLAADADFHAEEKTAARRRAEAAFGYEAFAERTVQALSSVIKK